MLNRIKEIFISAKGYYFFLFLTVTSILFLLYTIFITGMKLRFDTSTGLYFYSSLIQANAAIISIFGVFFIFRLQSIQSSISEIYESLCRLNRTNENAARAFRQMTFEQKKQKIDSSQGSIDILYEYKKWFMYESIINDTKTNLKKPTSILITIISIQILFLIFSNTTHNMGTAFELLCFLLLTVFEIYVLILLGKTIFRMV